MQRIESDESARHLIARSVCGPDAGPRWEVRADALRHQVAGAIARTSASLSNCSTAVPELWRRRWVPSGSVAHSSSVSGPLRDGANRLASHLNSGLHGWSGPVGSPHKGGTEHGGP